MGTTEENIVYQLLNVIRGSELSNDEVITERRIRSFLRSHRIRELYKLMNKSQSVPDEYFQQIGLQFERINEHEYIATVPSIVQLPDNMGVKFTNRYFEAIPVVKEEEYHLSKKNSINRYKSMGKIESGTLTFYVPSNSPFTDNNAEVLQVINNCMTHNIDNTILKAVLDNPDDAENYDWTTDPYPVVEEQIQVIKENLLRREFSIIAQGKSDQVGNMKNDTLRYHDEGKVQP